MIDLLIYLVVLCLIFGLIYWVVGMLPIAQPFKTVILVVLAIILILILLSMIGVLPTGHTWKLR